GSLRPAATRTKRSRSRVVRPATPACGTLRAILRRTPGTCSRSIRCSRPSRTSRRAQACSGGIFDFANRKDRLAEVELELAEPSVWDNPERAQELGRERSSLEQIVSTIEKLEGATGDAADLLELAAVEDDEGTVAEVKADIDKLVKL